MKNRLINKEAFFVLLFISLAMVAFFPTVYNSEGLYRLSKIAIFITLAFLTFSTRITKALNNKVIVMSLAVIIFISVQLLVFSSLRFYVRWSNLTAIVITTLIISIGYCCHANERQIEMFVLVFAALAIIAGVLSMFYYVGSLSLTQYLYAVDAKNQIGQFVACAGVGMTVILFSNKNQFIFKITLLSLIVILLFVLRCRTALLAFLVFGLYYYYKSQNATKVVLVFLLVVLLSLLFFSPIVSFFQDVFVGNKDISDTNAISSGRIERNIDGMKFWWENPVFGEMATPSGVSRIHNYFINTLVAYGLFSFPFLLLYLYLFFVAFRGWRNNNPLAIEGVGFWMLFIPFFCSLLEPSAPYGPGLVQAIPFFLFGNSLRLVSQN